MDDFISFAISVYVGFIIGVLVIAIPMSKAQRRLRTEAIEHGYAEYVIIDKSTGKAEWRWIERKIDE